NNTGNVGIGTTTPGEKLEISGNIKLSGDSGSIFKSGTYPFRTYWYYEDDGTPYGPAWIHKNTASGNTYPTLFLRSQGDGAILTADYALELGDMTVTLGSYPSITTRTRISGGSGENSYFNTGGNVGIGTTTPNAKLVIDAGSGGGAGNELLIAKNGVACPIWKDCDGDGKTYGNGDCDESCATCYAGSLSYTFSPDGKDQDCNGVVDDSHPVY
ncbi:MAG: hypothetical protein ACP5PR_02660, partial [Minisyncoccia bacterium]